MKTSIPDTLSSPLCTKLKNYRLHIILDNVRSAYNVGAFFRIADATGCTMLHLCGITAYPPNPKLEKTALGTTETVAWKYYSSTDEAVTAIRKQKIILYSCEYTKDSVDYRSVDYPLPIALIFGHELEGVQEGIIRKSDKLISIPMRGTKSSLNVETAGSVIIYEALRSIN